MFAEVRLMEYSRKNPLAVRHRSSQVVHPAQVESMTHQELLKEVVEP